MLFLRYETGYGAHILKPAADIAEICIVENGGSRVIFKDGAEVYMDDVMECFIDIVGGEDEA